MPVPFNEPQFNSRDLENLMIAIGSKHSAGDGPFGRRAERLLSELHSSAPALLTTSCTHSLELAARLMKLQPGDEVIVPAYTFVTTASAFATVGAIPVFADVRDDTLNIDPAHVETLISERTRGICIVHYGGVGADPERYVEISRRHGIALVEDNAHGLAGKYSGRPLGTFGDLSTLSFHETKNVTCGEGGAIIVNRPEFVDRARVLRDKGTNRRAFLDGQIDKYSWVDVGSSWGLSDLLASILVSQLERLEFIQSQRVHRWDRYFLALKPWTASTNIRLQHIPERAEHTAHMFHLRLPNLAERNRFISHMKDRHINVVFHYQSLNDSEVGRAIGRPSECPVAQRASETLVRLPLFTTITDSQQDQVIEAVRSFPM